MDRKLNACLGVLLGACATFTPAAAQQQTSGVAGEWLATYTSARTLGLGGAYTAMADDPLGILSNPAGLSFMDQNEVRFESARLFEQTSINSFGFAVPGSRWPSLGFAIVSLGTGDIERTNDVNDNLGSFKESETAYLLTASKSVTPKIALGANFKMVQQSVESFNAGGFGMDLGAIVQVSRDLRLGASVMNAGGPKLKLRDVEEAYPTQVRGGAALTVFNGRGLMSLEADHSEGLGARLHAGAEYWIQSGMALRMGWNNDGGTGGFTYRFAPNYAIDYAAADHPLGLQHRIGVSAKFGGFFASSSAEPTLFSPIGEHAETRISLNSRTKAEPVTWTLDIINKSDDVVRTFGGQGQPPSHIQWDGKSETGMPLPDGIYRYNLVVKDKAGRKVEGPTHSLQISTAGPQGTVPLVPPIEVQR